MIHFSHRGKPVDMEMMRVQNGDKVALGNAHLNARGDMIGAGGVVIKTRAELIKEKERECALPDIDPTALEETFFDTPGLDDNQFLADPVQQAPAPAAPKRAPRRPSSTTSEGE